MAGAISTSTVAATQLTSTTHSDSSPKGRALGTDKTVGPTMVVIIPVGGVDGLHNVRRGIKADNVGTRVIKGEEGNRKQDRVSQTRGGKPVDTTYDPYEN